MFETAREAGKSIGPVTVSVNLFWLDIKRSIRT